jgi:outer membrane protein assembly factor BamB
MLTKLSSVLVVIITALWLDYSTAKIASAQWDRFRGANGAGTVDQCNVPLPWSEGDVAWRVNLPGKGNGSPIVVGDKVFIMSADPTSAERYALAYSLTTGKELWRKPFASKEHKLHTRSSYASCTPCASSDSVYFAWATPDSLIVKSLSHAGQEQWTKELGRYISAHGFGASPILVDDKLILPNSQDAEELPPGVAPGESSIIALEAATGEIAWETPRKSVRTSYGTPTVVTDDNGKKVLIFAETGDGFFALDAATGKPLWNKQVFSKRCVSCPVVVGNIVIGTEGSGGGGNVLFGVDLRGNHDLVYEIKRSAPYVPTPVSKGDLLFLWSDNGIVSCVDAKSGEQRWSERIGGNVSTSPVIAGDKLIGIAEDGTVTVLSATSNFKKFGEVKLGETTRSTPLVSTNYILLRSDSKLVCVGRIK